MIENFITFEGGEGSGKSTQAKLLYSSIKNISLKATLTREPGGNISAEKIRKLIVESQKTVLDPLSELLLIYAARNEHLKKTIIPKLIKNEIVLCDRYIDSTFIYQIKVKKLEQRIFNYLNKIVVNSYLPRLSFIIDLDPEIGIKRSLKIKQKETKFEKLPISFHQSVRKNYILLSKGDKRFKLLDGTKNMYELHEEIVSIINKGKILKKIIQPVEL